MHHQTIETSREHRRDRLPNRDATAVELFDELGRIDRGLVAQDHDRRTHHERREVLPDDDVEQEPSGLRHDVARRQLQVVHLGAKVVQQSGVLDHRAFRLAARARREHDVRQPLRIRQRHRGWRRDGVRVDHVGPPVGRTEVDIRSGRVSDDPADRGLAYQPSPVLDRRARTEREERGADPEHGQHHDRDLDASFEVERDQVTLTHARCAQRPGQPRGPFVQLAIRQLPGRLDDGGMTGVRRNRALELRPH